MYSLLLMLAFFCARHVPSGPALADAQPIARETLAPVRKPITVASAIVKKPLESHLIIPEIHVNATIKSLGETSAGAMAVPANRTDVGWFNLGAIPGETGSAVIGGHNYWNGSGVFARLDELVAGDSLSVVDAKGVLTTFVVRETRLYKPTDDATDIFTSDSGSHLNLITCAGVWDTSTKSYTKRLVVFADEVPNVSTL